MEVVLMRLYEEESQALFMREEFSFLLVGRKEFKTF